MSLPVWSHVPSGGLSRGEVDRQTPVKTLPSLTVGKYSNRRLYWVVSTTEHFNISVNYNLLIVTGARSN